MKKILGIFVFGLMFAFGGSILAQDKMDSMKSDKSEKGEMMEMDHASPTDKDKTEAIPTDGYLKRGAAIGDSKSVALADVLKEPAKYANQTVQVKGVVVRSCKMEGCWLELAPDANAKSVRVKLKDHAFFVPLDSAGANARIEGVFSVKTISKEMVKHMMEEDGAKFENVNADGTVTEVSLEATGVELTRKI